MRLFFLFLLLGLGLAPAPRAAAQGWRWATPIRGTNHVNASATNAAGDTYVVGDFFGTIRFDSLTLTAHAVSANDVDGFIAKVSASGRWQWARQIAVPDTAYETVAAVAVDRAGDAVLTGWGSPFGDYNPLALAFDTTHLLVNPEQLFVARISAAGQWRWAVAAGPTSQGTLLAHDIACDTATNRVAITGHYKGVATFGPSTLPTLPIGLTQPEIFVAQLDGATGQWEWGQAAGGRGAEDYGRAVAFDPTTHEVIVAGTFNGPNAHFGSTIMYNASTLASTDVFVGRLTPTGFWQRVARAGGTSSDFLTDLQVDSAGLAYVVGQLGGGGNLTFPPVTITDGGTGSSGGTSRTAFVAKLNRNARWQWATVPASYSENAITRLALRHDSVTVAGVFGYYATGSGSPIMFGADTLRLVGVSDVYVAQVDARTGLWERAMSVGGAEEDEPWGLSLLPDGGLVVAGQSRSPTLPLGTPALVNVAAPLDYGGFVARSTGRWRNGGGGGPTAVASCAALAPFTLSPNPAHHAVRLLGAPTGPVQLLDALGRTVRTYAAPAATFLDLTGLPPGLYTVRAGGAARRLVVE